MKDIRHLYEFSMYLYTMFKEVYMQADERFNPIIKFLHNEISLTKSIMNYIY